MTPRGRPHKQLAKVGDPLVKDGRIISPDPLPDEDQDEDNTIIRQECQPEDFRPIVQRSIKELQASVPQLNAAATVLVYTTLGLPDVEICESLGISIDALTRIRKHAIYADCFHAFTSEFINANSSMLQARIAAYSHDALSTVAFIAKSGKKEASRLRASTDLLDRAGVRAKTANELQGMANNSLRITIVKAEDAAIDVKLSHGEEADG